MDNQFRYANVPDALSAIQGDAGGISTGPIVDLGSGVDRVNLIGGGTLYPVLQGQKDINLLTVAGIMNTQPVTVFGTFMLNGALFQNNASPINNAPGTVPFDPSQPTGAAAINPTNFGFANPSQLPSSIPMTTECHVNLKSFDSQSIEMTSANNTCYLEDHGNNLCLDNDPNNDPADCNTPDGIVDGDWDSDGNIEINDPCKVNRAVILAEQHLQAVQALNACTDTPLTSSDVTFRGPGDYAY